MSRGCSSTGCAPHRIRHTRRSTAPWSSSTSLGFTALTERLARHGKVGAEEMSGTLDAMFTALLDVAYQDGAGLVKWGGDAVLLLFDGPAHAPRACRAAHRMRATLRERGRLDTSAGRVTLRMSVGIHSGDFHFFLVGDPTHRELIVAGPVASETVRHGGDRRRRRDRHQPPDGGAAASVLRRAAQGCGAAAALRPGGRGPGAVSHLRGRDRGRPRPGAASRHPRAPARQPGDAEHRKVAVAFVQFSGTDALLAQQGPAALAEALDEVIANAARRPRTGSRSSRPTSTATAARSC